MSAPVLMVSSQFAQHLDFFDTASFEHLARVEGLLAQPHEMAWDDGRRLAYLTHTYRAGAYGEGKPKAHELSVVDPDARAVVDVIDIAPYLAPHDVEFDPVADRIYTGVELEDGRNGIVVIDAARREVVGNIPLDAPNAHWLCLTPDGARAYVAHKEAPVISVVDLRAGRQVAEIPSPGGAEEIDCSPDGRFVYAATPMMSLTVNVSQGRLTKRTPPPGTPTPRLLKIDTEREEVVGRFETHEYLSALRVAPDGRVLVTEFWFPAPDAVTPGPVPGRLDVVDPETMTLSAAIELDELPFTVRVSPDSTTAYVANLKTGSVSVVDLVENTVRARLDNNIGPAFGGSHGMCLVPAGEAGR
ncbi:YncE family protein [Actinomycetospora termitidis]|uniref:YncE family protein n=1 Tax=Actinomycetospora termitidis TaxID=3053470 RepID=A0ABT7MG52_9PSEU|nr:YncE family protein [Actinomycetospora sp. Odt1-22]MDL5159655.1 YncE family protein [Actinomycetospora sp. Odt1-22]